MKDDRPVCTKENSLKDKGRYAKHPNQKYCYTLDNDYDDERWECVDCGFSWIKEGSDY